VGEEAESTRSTADAAHNLESEIEEVHPKQVEGKGG